MKKIVLFLFLFTIFLTFSSASSLTLSPAHLNFKGIKNERICQNFSINSNKEISLVGKTLWEKEGEQDRILQNHKLNSSSLGLKTIFPEKIVGEKNSIQEFCLISNSSGVFHGVLLYKIESEPTQVGIWINATIFSSKKSQEESFSEVELKGNSAKENSLVNNFEIFIFFDVIILISILFLFKNLFKKTKNEFTKK